LARKKRTFKREKRGLRIVGNRIILTCYECNIQRESLKNNRDTDEVLDVEAVGWYTLLSGISLCPQCRVKRGITQDNIHPLTETIFGDQDARREAFARYLAHTKDLTNGNRRHQKALQHPRSTESVKQPPMDSMPSADSSS
jgi:hypothetical protein